MKIKQYALPVLLAGTLGTNLALLARRDAAVSDLETARSVSRAVRRVADEVSDAVVSVRARWETASGRVVDQEGSGVLVSPDGRIVTNYHVVGDVDACEVRLFDDRVLRGVVVGKDPDSDLVLLKVAVEDHAYLEFSDDPPPPIGTWVLAVGNPLGYDHSVTFGIISARGRVAGLENVVYEDFLQTDAAINSGNSGGPLIDLEGRVVGINTAKEIRGGSQGLGFAIPAYMVRDVVQQLGSQGFVERGYFGIGVREFGRRGLFVTDVRPDSPAERAGFSRGDRIVAVAGREVESRRELFDLIAKLKPGSQVDARVDRSGEVLELEVRVSQRR